MIHSELNKAIAQHFDYLSEQDVHFCVHKLISSMTQSLSQGMEIEIRNFGCFRLIMRPSRRARNPKTGETLLTIAKNVVRFKPGKGLKETINNPS